MPLVVATLTTELQKFMDDSYGGFVAFPTDELDAAALWAAAIDTYAGVNLTPPSTASAAAKSALQGGLTGMSAPGAGPAIFDTAFVAYASAMALGMAPAMVGVPPVPGTLVVGLVASAAAALPPNPSKPPAVQLGILAGVIDTWFRTGTATPSGGGPPVPWA